MTKAELYKKACMLPLLPGVYIIRDKSDTIIYIGKAKRLRIRVSQYFREGVPHDNKVSQMIAHAYAFDVIVCQSEFEALVLEASQIKAHTPKYNILLKDDKGYSYIRVTREDWPRLSFTLQKEEDGAEYIGPYTSSFAARQMFWRVGRGYMKKLEENGLYTMGDIARCSVGTPEDFYNEALLYRLFGVNAELLIDHAWGWESCTMQEIKEYKPSANSLGSGQVLQCPYPYEKARLVVREMADQLALELVDKELVTDQVVLTVGYDIENLRDPSIRGRYHGEVKKDHYGRMVPKHAHGTANLPTATSSTKEILEAVTGLYEEIVNPLLFVRRISLTANKVVSEKDVTVGQSFEQLDLFTDYAALEVKKKEVQEERNREKSVQKAVLDIKKKYGKNAVLKGMNLIEGATAVARNRQIGGHKA